MLNKTKYWILTTEYPPFHGGGISTYCQNTALMLKDKGIDVTVFIYDLSLNRDEVSTENGIRVVRFVPRKTGTHLFLGFQASLSYEYAFIVHQWAEREGAPTVIESQEYNGIAYYLQQFKLLGYPLLQESLILITCHAPSFVCLDYNHVPVFQFPEYWTGQMEKASIKSADLLVSPSQYFVQEAKSRMEWGGTEETYIPNPIRINKQVSAPPDYAPNRIICFGKLSPLKGTFRLLQYFKKLWEGGFEHPLHIVGGTDQMFHPEGMTMGDLARKNYGDFIDKGLLVLHNEASPAQAKAMLERAHVVLVPSLFDNLPYTVLEAMSWGKVVLASRQGGQSEVIEHGINGFLFDHHTTDDFSRQLLHILGLPAESLLNVAVNAQETIARQFNPEVIYKAKMAAIERTIEGKEQQTSFPFISTVQAPVAIAPALVQSSEDNKDLLSIVIPFYNMGAYIEECVQSVLNSDYPAKEVIIVNDGSTDPESIRILTHIESTYGVRVCHKVNEGLPRARNYGAAQANGEFLAYLDADDTVDPRYYSKAIAVLNKFDNVHFVGCWTKYTGEGKGYWPGFNPEPPYLLVHNMVNSSALVYKKASLMKGGLNDEDFVYGMEDWDSVLNMVGHGLGGVVLPEALFFYRVRKGSMARQFTRVKRLYLHKLIAEKHRALYQQYAPEVTNLLNSNGSSLTFDNPTFGSGAGSLWPFSQARKEQLRELVRKNKSARKVAYFIYKQIKK